MPESGTLYIVATPIGNPQDITLRAIEVLRNADIVVCEERKEGARLMHQLGLTKELVLLNEHNERNEDEHMQELITMLREGKSLALISDCGTPLIADPGNILVQMAIDFKIPIVPVPGVNSFITALTVSGFDTRQFVFRGMLSAKTDERKRELRLLRNEKRTIILFDAPYRLERLISELAATFGDSREAIVALDLTLPKEAVLRGTLNEIYAMVQGKNWKREFIVVLAGIV
ncbi:MAG TPA: 16S rRNA (cytidine(1402)-2'-O)-methyltransferase [Candidatus Kapabacteria bacterium]|nr:16S rRNA (cytidine(1402)-2'-O)-methyltransferase [Candidatus Kapabacteria bacterium]